MGRVRERVSANRAILTPCYGCSAPPFGGRRGATLDTCSGSGALAQGSAPAKR